MNINDYKKNRCSVAMNSSYKSSIKNISGNMNNWMECGVNIWNIMGC